MNATIWFNKNFSNTFNVIELLRNKKPSENIKIICTHTQAGFLAGLVADQQEIEPPIEDKSEYSKYALNFCAINKINLFMPGKNRISLAHNRKYFQEKGVELMVAASPEIMEILECKERQYKACPETIPVPFWKSCQNAEEFESAYSAVISQGKTACIKPSVSLNGIGFKKIAHSGGKFRRFFSGDSIGLGLDDCRRALEAEKSFPRMVVMEYLPGIERSVDCLGHRGQLVCAVVRKKNDDEPCQWIDKHQEIQDYCCELTRHFQLTGLYNIQFREDRNGKSRFLEINARMSGGLVQSCEAGVNLPLWAVRLALGSAEPSDIPIPNTGFRVGVVNRILKS